MPSLGVYFSNEEAEMVEAAAKAADQKVAPYIAEATRRRLEAEGHLPGTPAHDIRKEALSAAEIAGDAAVLAALKDAKSGKYKDAA